MKKIIFPIITMFLFTYEFIYAQPGLPTSPSQAPIDGGLGVLVAVGGIYAIKKLRDKK